MRESRKVFRQMTDTEIDEMIRLRKRGCSYKQIAKRVNCALSTATRRTNHINVESIKDKIIALLLEGKKFKYIADVVETSYQYVSMVSQNIDMKEVKSKRYSSKARADIEKERELEQYKEQVKKICKKVEADKIRHLKELEIQKKIEIENCIWQCNVRIQEVSVC